MQQVAWSCGFAPKNKQFWSPFLDFDLSGTLFVLSHCLVESIRLLLCQHPSDFLHRAMRMLPLQLGQAIVRFGLHQKTSLSTALPSGRLALRARHPYIDKANWQVNEHDDPNEAYVTMIVVMLPCEHACQSTMWVQIGRIVGTVWTA